MSIVVCYTMYKVIKMHDIKSYKNKAIKSLVSIKPTYIWLKAIVRMHCICNRATDMDGRGLAYQKQLLAGESMLLILCWGLVTITLTLNALYSDHKRTEKPCYEVVKYTWRTCQSVVDVHRGWPCRQHGVAVWRRVAADQLSLALTTPVSKSERRRNTRPAPAVHDRRLAVKPCVRQATAIK